MRGERTGGADRAAGSDELLRLVLESATDYAIFTTDPDGRITSWSPGAQAVFGFPPEEAIGQAAALIFTPEDRAAGADVHELETARGQGCANDERWHLRKDGTRVFINGSVRPLHDDAGALRGFLKIGRDETAQRRSADRLSESEQRFRNMADHAPVMIWTTDPTGYCTYLNRRWYEFTGQSEIEALGFGWLEVTHPDDKPRAEAAFRDANAAHAPFRVEYRLRRADGAYRWAIDAASPRFGPNGEFLGYIGSVIDIEERHEAERSLRESEARFRTLADNIPQLCWMADTTGYIFWYNRRWHDYTGSPPEEQEGWGWESVHDPEVLPEVVERWRRSLETGQPFEMTFPLRGADGVFRPFLTRVVPIRDAGGALVLWFGTNTDVTELRAAEAALAESESRFRAITDSIDQMIWSTRPDGYHDYYNQRWYDYTGVPEGSTDGEAWNGMFHPDDQARAWERWRRSLATGEPYEIEYRLRRGDGVYRWVLGRALPVRDAQGSIVRWFGTCTDIDDQVRAREMLSAYRSELERQVEARTRERDRIWSMSDDLFAVMGFDGHLKSINPAWSRLLGYDEATLLSVPFGDIVHPDDHPRISGLVETLRQGRVVHHFEDRLRKADGAYAVISWTASPEPGSEVFYAVGRDVTREREREEQLRQAQKMEAVGQLTGGVAHDFNNLLQIVVGNLEIVQRHLPEEAPRLRRSTENAMQGARRAVTLTQRLLAFSRRQPLDPRALEPNKLVSGMSELLARALGETIALECVLAGGLWRVEADSNQLEAAILNLAVNARDAMPDGGKLTIETANTHLDQSYARQNVEVAPGQYVVICVSDTGVGMNKDAAVRAFEPFFTTKEPGKGTGLGLSQVYGFVKQSGGHVKIYSEPGQGTTVKLYLPRHKGAAEVTASEPLAAAPKGAETVLVVEDDADVRSYTVEVLRELGYCVLEAETGPAALALLEHETVDLLFTDVVLPGGLNGEQLALQARERRPGLRTLFTTGYARNAIVHHGRLDAGVQLVTKPFSYSELAARVREVLDAPPQPLPF